MSSAMLRRLIKTRDRAETQRVMLAFTVLLLEVGAHTVVKAVRDAVFLSRFEVRDLSLIAIGLALTIGLVLTTYLKVTRALARNAVIVGTNVLVAGTLVAIWFGLRGDAPPGWVAWLLYIWSGIFVVFLLSQFWLLAGDVFDLREAKRVFGVVGAGAIAGGLLGGLAVRGLAGLMGTAGLLLLAAAMLGVAAVLVQRLWKLRRPAPPHEGRPNAKEQEPPAPRLRDLVTRPSYARLIAVLVLVATVVTTLLDWQLKSVAKAHFGDNTDDMAAFFGSLSFFLSGASLLLQVGATSWLLRRFGVGAGLRVLPIILVTGSVVIVAHGLLPLSLLMALALIKVAEGGARFTVDKASLELIWLPVPAAVRSTGKVVVDTVVDRLGTGLTGAIWLLIAAVGLDEPDLIHWVSILTLCLGLLWLAIATRTRRAYLDAFRQALAGRTLDLSHFKYSLAGAEVQDTLATALRSGEEGQIRFALYLLETNPSFAVPDLTLALEHDEASVRVQALHLLADRLDPEHRAAAAQTLQHPSFEVRLAALRYLTASAQPRPGGAADPALASVSGDDLEAQTIRALLAVSSQASPASSGDPSQPSTPPTSPSSGRGPTESAPDMEAVQRILSQSKGCDRTGAIRLVGAAPSAVASELLAPLLDDDDPAVVRAALNAAGRARTEGLVTRLGEMLSQRRWRPRALTALGRIGEPSLQTLLPGLEDETQPLATRLAIVRLVGSTRDPAVAVRLVPLLERRHHPALSRAALRALSRLRGRVPMEVDAAVVSALLFDELRELCWELVFLGRGPWPTAREPQPDDALLVRAVRESADARIRRVFQLLGLLFLDEDMRAIGRGALSATRATRLRSVEFLDNLVDPDLGRALLPAIEDGPPSQVTALATQLLDLSEVSHSIGIQRLLSGPDRWLKAVSARAAGIEGVTEAVPALVALVESSDENGDDAVRQIAKRALGRLGKAGPNETEPNRELTMGLTLIEKALKLQSVDVLARASSEDLAYLAQIAEEITVPTGEQIYGHGDAPDALYVLVSGSVRLARGDVEIGTLQAGEAFGTWALFDEAPRLASAIAENECSLLKVDREEFLELLADRVDIVQAVFRAMVERIRNLAALAGDL